VYTAVSSISSAKVAVSFLGLSKLTNFLDGFSRVEGYFSFLKVGESNLSFATLAMLRPLLEDTCLLNGADLSP
jgi:hypothetical protein